MPSFNMSPARLQRLVGAAAAIVLAACSAAEDPVIIRDPPMFSIDLRGTVVTRDSGLPSDAITIDSARVEGDTLSAAVSHGGGCAYHSYQLVISSTWLESFPVQAPARVAHDANGDPCRMLVRQNLRMNLSPLAEAYRASYKQAHGSVLIQLPGAPTPLLYKF